MNCFASGFETLIDLLQYAGTKIQRDSLAASLLLAIIDIYILLDIAGAIYVFVRYCLDTNS